MQVGTQAGYTKMPFLKVVAMVTTAACSGPEASFLYKKRVKCLFLYLKLNTTLQTGNSTVHSNIICLGTDLVIFVGTNWHFYHTY